MKASLLTIMCCFGLFWTQAQSISRSYSDNDTSFFLSLATHDFKYFEEDKPILDLSKLQAPCFITESIEKIDGTRLSIKRGRENRIYNRKGGLYCQYEGQIIDPFSHSKNVSIKWRNGLCDRFSRISTTENQISNTEFTLSYTDVLEDSKLIEEIKDLSTASVKGQVKSRMSPLGKRSIKAFGAQEKLELFRIEEEFKIISVDLKSRSGKSKSLTGYEINKYFHQYKKIRYVFYDPVSGLDKMIINIEPSQRTIVESLFYRIGEQPKNVISCVGSKDQNIYLFPNPTFGEVFLKFDGYKPGNYEFVIYNIIGKSIANIPFELLEEEAQVKIMLPQLNKGTYLYSVKNEVGKRLVSRRLSIIRY